MPAKYRKKQAHKTTLRQPRRLVYGGVLSAVVIGLASLAFVARSNAAEPADRATGSSSSSSSTASDGSSSSTTAKPATSSTASSAAASCNQARIQKLVNSVSQAKIKANLQSLVQDDTKPKPNDLISRHVSAPGNKIKVNWAKKRMKSYKLQVINQPFTSDGRKLDNVLSRVTGTDANSFYVVGAHIDSISQKSKTHAPGADDDASGVVAMMEAGRVLKAFQPCMKTSIDFLGFNDEEENLGGSKHYVKTMRSSSKKIKGMYNMDMIGYAPDGECLKSDVKKSSRDKAMAQKIVDVNKKYKVGLKVSTGTYTQNAGDDLEPFWKANIPGAYLIECATEKDPEDYPGYHSTKDVAKNVNIPQVTKTAKLLVAALAELSMKASSSSGAAN